MGWSFFKWWEEYVNLCKLFVLMHVKVPGRASDFSFMFAFLRTLLFWYDTVVIYIHAYISTFVLYCNWILGGKTGMYIDVVSGWVGGWQ